MSLIPDRLALICGSKSEISVLDQILESLGAEIRCLDSTLLHACSQEMDADLHRVHRFCDDLASRLSSRGSGFLVFNVPATYLSQASFIFAAFMTLRFGWTTSDLLRKFPHLDLSDASNKYPSVSFPFSYFLLRLSKDRCWRASLVSYKRHNNILNKDIITACDEGATRNAGAIREAVEARSAWCGEDFLMSSTAAAHSSCLFRSPLSQRGRRDGSESRESRMRKTTGAVFS